METAINNSVTALALTNIKATCDVWDLDTTHVELHHAHSGRSNAMYNKDELVSLAAGMIYSNLLILSLYNAAALLIYNVYQFREG